MTATTSGLIEEEKHRAIIYGNHVKAYYAVREYYCDPEVVQRWEITDSRYELFNGVLDRPLINAGESIFLETKEVVKIDSRVRNVNGGYVYLTSFEALKTIDETSEASRVEAEAHLIEVIEQKKSQAATREFDEKCKAYNKLRWYKKLFTAKPSKENHNEPRPF